MVNIKEMEKKFKVFLDEYFKKKGKKNIKPDTDLIQNNIIDSLDIVTLIYEIKKKFKVEINLNENRSLDNFSTIKGLIKIFRKNLK